MPPPPTSQRSNWVQGLWLHHVTAGEETELKNKKHTHTHHHHDIKTRAVSRVWVEIPSTWLLSYQGAPEQHKQEVPGPRAMQMLRHVSFMFVHAYLSLSLTFTRYHTCSFYSRRITRWWLFTEEFLGPHFQDVFFSRLFSCNVNVNLLFNLIWSYCLIYYKYIFDLLVIPWFPVWSYYFQHNQNLSQYWALS